MPYQLAVNGISGGGHADSIFQVQNIDNYLPTSKGKVQPRMSHEGPEREQRYSCTVSFTLALDGGGPHGPPGQVPETLPPPGFKARTVQPVGSRYTNYSELALQTQYHITED
jgi:hypothetical protein